MMSTKRAGTAVFQAVHTLPQHRRRTVVALTLAALVALGGVLARPSTPSLSTQVTGDAALAARATARARPPRPGQHRRGGWRHRHLRRLRRERTHRVRDRLAHQDLYRGAPGG